MINEVLLRFGLVCLSLYVQAQLPQQEAKHNQDI